jgi:hypothetical protein
MRALSFGVLAQEAILGSWPASVIGVTSGGVFIISKNQRVLFLTYSPFHSPSTINLEHNLVDLRQNENGAKVSLARDQIRFPDTGLAVDLEGALVWMAEPPGSLSETQHSGISERLRRAVRSAAEQKGAQGLAPVLGWLVGQGEAEMTGDMTEKVFAGLIDMRIAINSWNLAGFFQAAGQIIGHGRGLTPAADDCIAGVILTLNRWGAQMKYYFDPHVLNAGILELARAKTTSLSVTIIEAAVMGQGDERILRVLDGIMDGNYNESVAIQNLVRMGHSSGVDTLAGITLVLTAGQLP